ncbi:hypothetical protein B0J13DRAFT_177392 [Dactylonectria estremocensis]|uniref:Uncharacterized protein n=1 Tax=Dactylonectria estremocensis TaxID=1079267 RepID=A0A9P9FC79_9HYPO|nr:hypothetical protein B0J13DRAFT_177392 [Dactylonectria estremocensis]
MTLTWPVALVRPCFLPLPNPHVTLPRVARSPDLQACRFLTMILVTWVGDLAGAEGGGKRFCLMVRQFALTHLHGASPVQPKPSANFSHKCKHCRHIHPARHLDAAEAWNQAVRPPTARPTNLVQSLCSATLPAMMRDLGFEPRPPSPLFRASIKRCSAALLRPTASASLRIPVTHTRWLCFLLLEGFADRHHGRMTRRLMAVQPRPLGCHRFLPISDLKRPWSPRWTADWVRDLSRVAALSMQVPA